MKLFRPFVYAYYFAKSYIRILLIIMLSILVRFGNSVNNFFSSNKDGV